MAVHGVGMQVGGESTNHFTHNNIKRDNQAISETFTILPALAMILMGFALFSILLSSAYNNIDQQHDQKEMFEISNTILEKICSPNAIFSNDGNYLQFDAFVSSSAEIFIQELQEKYRPYGYNFAVKLSCKDVVAWIPSSFSQPNDILNQYASSKQVAIKLNEVSTNPGTLTIIFWKTPI